METLDRSKFIGGSDISAIMGLSRWSTPMGVWAIKTGLVDSPDLSENEAVQLGIELEDFVARKFVKKSGIEVHSENLEVVHKDYPYMVGHLDRWTADGLPMECKTASAWKLTEWEGQDIPQEYLLQFMWYLGLAGKQRGWIAVLIGGQKFIYKQVEFNQVLFDKMVEAAKSFWENYVLAEVAPMAIAGDKDLMAQIYPESNDSVKLLTGDEEIELNSLVDERGGGKEQLELVSKEVERIENRIKQILGESGSAETGQYKVTWKSQSRTSVDSDALKNAGLYDKYSITKSIRVLRAVGRKDSAK